MSGTILIQVKTWDRKLPERKRPILAQKMERDWRKILVEVKSTLTQATIPSAIREMLGREDTVAAIILNGNFHKLVKHGGKHVFFLPYILAYTITRLWEEI